MSLLMGTGLAGCTVGRVQTEALSARVRQREAEVLQLQQELADTRVQLDSTTRELAQIKRGQPAPDVFALTSATVSTKPPATLEFHPRFTVAQDDDGQPGNDSVAVLLTPRDSDGTPTRVDGSLVVVVGETTVYGRWKSEGSLDQYWYNGILGSGYQFNIPVDVNMPDAPLRVQAQLRLPEGEVLTATHRLRASGMQKEVVPAAAIEKRSVSIGLVPDPIDLPDASPTFAGTSAPAPGIAHLQSPSGSVSRTETSRVARKASIDSATLAQSGDASTTRIDASVNWTETSMPVRR